MQRGRGLGHRLLLRLYPSAFRAEYGDELRYDFQRRRDRCSGPLEVATLWVGEAVDVLVHAVGAHLDLLRQDLRYALRTLRRAPGFALTVVLVVGIGVGATTAAFTLADHVLVRPLPFAEPGRLVKLWKSPPGYARMELSPSNYREWRERARSFETIAAFTDVSANLVGSGEPRRIEGAWVTSELLPLLGATPLLGRTFVAEDDRAGAPGTVLLGHGLWLDAFGGDAGVLGRKVLLDGEPFTVVGVMPRGFRFPTRETEYWAPFRFRPEAFEYPNDNYLDVVARLLPGVSLEAAQADMSDIASQLEREHPVDYASTGATVHFLRDEVSRQSRLLLVVLAAAAGCMLLLACTNLGGMLLARGLERRPELAVRASLGSGRERLVRQLLTESFLLAFFGGLVGVGLAIAALPTLARLVPRVLPVAGVPEMDGRVLALALLVTVLTGLGFGILPALRAGGSPDLATLRAGTRGGGARRERLRAALVTVQVATSVALLLVSALLLRALVRVQATDPGFRAESVLSVRTWLPMPKYELTTRREQLYARVLSEVKALPGVRAAGYVSFVPMVMGGGIFPVVIEGRPADPSAPEVAALRVVTPGYFEAMDIPLLEGRDTGPSDTLETAAVAVVSDSFVRRHWPGQDPLGRRFDFGFRERTVVGVVGDVRMRGLERPAEPQVYLASAQMQDSMLAYYYAPKDLVIRAEKDPLALLAAVREIVGAADPEQPISDVRLLADVLAENTAPRRVQVRVLAAFAGIALLLAALGLHGLLSFAVSQRKQEIGVRVALGARRSSVVAMVVRQSAMFALAGVVVGVGAGIAAGRSMSALLAGGAPVDLVAIGLAVGLAVSISLVGSLLPALRAARVDPTIAIREG